MLLKDINPRKYPLRWAQRDPTRDYIDHMEERGTKGGITVEMPTGKPIDEIFQDWETLLTFRDSKASSRGHRVHFIIGGGDDGDDLDGPRVAFSLDSIANTEEIEQFETRHHWKHDNYFFFCRRERPAPKDPLMYPASKDPLMNILFFRPKDGAHKGKLFRFTVALNPLLLPRKHVRRAGLDGGQEQLPCETKKKFKNHTKPVLVSFVKLLLRGKCSFSKIVYMATIGVGYLRPPTDMFPRKRGQFSNRSLRLRELLPRADCHEFIGLDFCRRSCENMMMLAASGVSSIKKLSFTSCTFSDGGLGMMTLVTQTKTLTAFELELCPIDSQAIQPIIDRASPLRIRSLAVGLHYINDNFATADSSNKGSMKNAWVQDLWKDASDLRIICREESLRRGVEHWLPFLESTIPNHPTLRVLHLTKAGASPYPGASSGEYPASMAVAAWGLTSRLSDETPLERICVRALNVDTATNQRMNQLLVGLDGWANSYLVRTTLRCQTRRQQRALKALRVNANSRPAMLPLLLSTAFHAGNADRKELLELHYYGRPLGGLDLVYSLLKENVDLLAGV